MPLPPAEPRERRHTRSIEFQGFEREDGLFDIEGHITDKKDYAFENKQRGMVQPGEPVHDMWVRVTITQDFEVKDVIVSIDTGPFDICSAVEDIYKSLIGLKIGPGWFMKIKKEVGGVKGCTHVVELFGPLATAAIQTVIPTLRRRKNEPSEFKDRPYQLNGCHALASDGPMVKERYPELYTGE
ncbi:MAG: DUF2889 domain-containing protein [Alphaproteobacteria bacterium]|nr:DUF2889 domain-containing protein [Rhodospirillales bacterium]MCW9045254.1 DUF2889 domain-containing protein [Alphaproteobacteria bacterium]